MQAKTKKTKILEKPVERVHGPPVDNLKSSIKKTKRNKTKSACIVPTGVKSHIAPSLRNIFIRPQI
jgi:hypothetical protein